MQVSLLTLKRLLTQSIMIFFQKAWILWYKRIIERQVPVLLKKNWKQFVLISNPTSNKKEIITRYPQGSVLEPLPFLLYINNLYRSVKNSKTYHYVNHTNAIIASNLILMGSWSHKITTLSIHLSAWTRWATC